MKNTGQSLALKCFFVPSSINIIHNILIIKQVNLDNLLTPIEAANKANY